MLETGDFVQIRNGEGAQPRTNRDLLAASAIRGGSQASGLARENPVWPYRIPSALGGLVAVLATFALWRGAFWRGMRLFA